MGGGGSSQPFRVVAEHPLPILNSQEWSVAAIMEAQPPPAIFNGKNVDSLPIIRVRPRKNRAFA